MYQYTYRYPTEHAHVGFVERPGFIGNFVLDRRTTGVRGDGALRLRRDDRNRPTVIALIDYDKRVLVHLPQPRQQARLAATR